MYCNEITYNAKWDTKKYRDKADAVVTKYDTPYWSDCPCSWADELLELFDEIDKRYGIAKNDSGLKSGFFIDKKGKKLHEKNSKWNKIHKPKVSLDQFKEKYGTLRVYFTCIDQKIEKEVERLIDTCQVRLIEKLKYPYPIYQCPKCLQKSTWYTFNIKDPTAKLCRYCNIKLKNASKTTKTNRKINSKSKA